MNKKPTQSELDELSRSLRLRVLDLVHSTRSPHVGSCFSIIEILAALYFRVMKVSPTKTHEPGRDRFILSKGHACAALYSVLRERGFMDEEHLKGFAVDGGTLEHHPTMDLERGIEASTGSLGHGLSIGAGLALAGKLDRMDYRVFVLMSDGELNEGSVWEAAMFAAHHRMDKLVAIIDINKIQALGFTKDIVDMEPLVAKWEGFGWHTQRCDGHDYGAILGAMDSLSAERPNAVLLDTVKGKGVSFMQNELLWHYRSPDDEEYARAKKELTG